MVRPYCYTLNARPPTPPPRCGLLCAWSHWGHELTTSYAYVEFPGGKPHHQKLHGLVCKYYGSVLLFMLVDKSACSGFLKNSVVTIGRRGACTTTTTTAIPGTKTRSVVGLVVHSLFRRSRQRDQQPRLAGSVAIRRYGLFRPEAGGHIHSDLFAIL